MAVFKEGSSLKHRRIVVSSAYGKHNQDDLANNHQPNRSEESIAKMSDSSKKTSKNEKVLVEQLERSIIAAIYYGGLPPDAKIKFDVTDNSLVFGDNKFNKTSLYTADGKHSAIMTSGNYWLCDPMDIDGMTKAVYNVRHDFLFEVLGHYNITLLNGPSGLKSLLMPHESNMIVQSINALKYKYPNTQVFYDGDVLVSNPDRAKQIQSEMDARLSLDASQFPYISYEKSGTTNPFGLKYGNDDTIYFYKIIDQSKSLGFIENDMIRVVVDNPDFKMTSDIEWYFVKNRDFDTFQNLVLQQGELEFKNAQTFKTSKLQEYYGSILDTLKSLYDNNKDELLKESPVRMWRHNRRPKSTRDLARRVNETLRSYAEPKPLLDIGKTINVNLSDGFDFEILDIDMSKYYDIDDVDTIELDDVGISEGDLPKSEYEVPLYSSDEDVEMPLIDENGELIYEDAQE